MADLHTFEPHAPSGRKLGAAGLPGSPLSRKPQNRPLILSGKPCGLPFFCRPEPVWPDRTVFVPDGLIFRWAGGRSWPYARMFSTKSRKMTVWPFLVAQAVWT